MLPAVIIVALIVSPAIRWSVLTGGITDDAGGDPLKIYRQPVALLGGLAIVVAVATGVFIGSRS